MIRNTVLAAASIACLSTASAYAEEMRMTAPDEIFRQGTSSMHVAAVMAGRDPGKLRGFLQVYPSSPLVATIRKNLEEIELKEPAMATPAVADPT
jgi:hypothetical protein